MKTSPLFLTGFGSVTTFGPLAGLIEAASPQPAIVTGWPTPVPRRAFLVDPFSPAAIVPGIKTRRLDRLSVWALVAASLALRDAAIHLDQTDRYRVAVICATGLGCVELTEAFFQSAAVNGWGGTDPIVFPETLGNAPAAHVALFHQLRGPNVTLSGKSFAAESALLQAAALLRHEQADLAIVLAGDVLTRPVYEWFEEAHLLSPGCFSQEPVTQTDGFVPAEGMTAVVMEVNPRSGARPYATLGAGRWAARGDAGNCAAELLAGHPPRFLFCAGSGAPCANQPAADFPRAIAGKNAVIYPAEPVANGLVDAGGLLHLLLALSKRPGPGLALLLGASAHGGYAALRLEVC